MGVGLLLALLLLGSAMAFADPHAPQCSVRDRRLYERDGHTYPARFRALAGWGWASRDEYARLVAKDSGLSPGCAACYADAYECGKLRCKWFCMRAGERCDACLTRRGCVQRTHRCTGF